MLRADELSTANPEGLNFFEGQVEEALLLQAEELFEILRGKGFTQASGVGGDQDLEIVVNVIVATIAVGGCGEMGIAGR